MFGKGALIYVAGFAMVFSMYQLKLNELTVGASGNFDYHYMRTIVHEAASTAINFGVNDVWANDTANDTFTIVVPPCTSFVSISTVGTDTVVVKAVSRTEVFDDDEFQTNNSTLTLTDSILAQFTYDTPLSRFFWYTNTENGVYWITGDTVWGPIHSNHILHTHGAPVYYGKATAKKGISPNPASNGNRAKFYGGWEVGIDATVPTDMSPLVTEAVAANGGAALNTVCLYNQTLYLDFFADGTVSRSIDGNPPDTVAISTIAPTGVLFNLRDIHVSGTFTGQLTLYSADDIWIDDDIQYVTNPMDDPTSTDYLGLVGYDDIIVADNASNNSDCNIHGSMLAVTGSFTAERYSTRTVAGALRIVGSICQNRRGPIGTFSVANGNVMTGFSKRYYYDPRLRYASPPRFPSIRELRLVSWWE